MAEFSELVQALTWLVTNRIQQKIQYTRGLLGDGNGRVRVSTIPGSPEVDYVFVRPDRFSNRVFEVFNKRIEGQDGDPIIIGELPWEPGLVQVVDMDWAAYADVGWGDDVTTTNRHGISHQWRDGAPGIDTFNVYRRQFGDLKTYSTTSGTLAVGVSPYSLDLFGKQYQWHGTQSFSLAGALPTTTGTARMALVYWSPASGTTQGFLGVATGTLGSGAEATILNRPVSPQGVIPSAFVRLAGGQTSITEFDIWDAREPFRPGLLFGTGSAGLSADMIPISDTSGLYTGSTVEAALDQIGFDGGRVSKVYESDFGAEVLLADATGNVGIGASGPDAKLDILDTAGAQLRLTFEDGVKFVDFTLDTNHDLTIRPSSTGQIKLQPTTDSTDFFQILDADGGTPIINVDSDDEGVQIGGTPAARLFNSSFTVANSTTDHTASKIASYVNFTPNLTSAAGALSYSAMRFDAQLDGSGGLGGDLIGVTGDARYNQTSGTLTRAAGGNFALRVINAGNVTTGYGCRVIPILSAAGNLTTYRGYDARPPSISGSGTITTAQAVYIDQQKVTGVTTGYGLYQVAEADLNYLRGKTGIGTASPQARLHVDQLSTTGATPVAFFDQADVSEEMFQFETTIGVGNPIEAVGAKTLTPTHFIKITLPGALTRYLVAGTIA